MIQMIRYKKEFEFGRHFSHFRQEIDGTFKLRRFHKDTTYEGVGRV